MTPRDLGRWRWLLDAGLLGLTLVTLAGFAAGLDWWFDLVCHFRPQYAILSACGLLAALAARDRRRAGLAGLLLALHAGLVLPLYLPGPPAPVGHRFSVLLCNVQFSNASPEKLVEQIQAADPDIVMVTELAEPAAKAMAALDHAYPFQILKTDSAAQSLGIYSRRPLTAPRLETIGDVGWVSAIATANIDGRAVTLVATHPAPPAGRPWLRMRNEQLAALGQWAAAQAGPLVLAGDLNTTSWSPAWKPLQRPANLVDTRQGYGPQGTWPSFSKLLTIPLDHVLVRDLGVVSRTVGPDVGSDHRPVVVALVVE